MTDRFNPAQPNGSQDDPNRDDGRAEQVLSQALRAMAGGGRSPGQPAGAEDSPQPRFTTGQLILLAAIVGLLIGIGAGFLSLLL